MAPPKIEPTNSGSSDSTSSGVCEVCKCGKHKVHDGIVCSCLAKKVILIMDSDSEDDSRSPQPDRVSVGRQKNDETTGGRGKHAEASGGKGKHVEQCGSKRRKEARSSFYANFIFLSSNSIIDNKLFSLSPPRVFSCSGTWRAVQTA
ncbi:hypothetical protein GUJ93_ZPchr0008g12622 [Zizania palustris]|uniref:Uncharacterized protein n=1 Tax=Zizania palustris TaxID=103762 RepID=A0A8J5R0M6_ZIZPA|nr:hypothetical protein GUJ93_ZPchr0008g12622 [Zizania palustris]